MILVSAVVAFAVLADPLLDYECIYVDDSYEDPVGYLDTCRVYDNTSLLECEGMKNCRRYQAPYDWYCWPCTSPGEGVCQCPWYDTILVPTWYGWHVDGVIDDQGCWWTGSQCLCRADPTKRYSYLYLCGT